MLDLSVYRTIALYPAGGMASGVQLAISMSNTGGAWDNAKKFIEKATPGSELQGKGSDIHKVWAASVCIAPCTHVKPRAGIVFIRLRRSNVEW